MSWQKWIRCRGIGHPGEGRVRVRKPQNLARTVAEIVSLMGPLSLLALTQRRMK